MLWCSLCRDSGAQVSEMQRRDSASTVLQVWASSADDMMSPSWQAGASATQGPHSGWRAGARNAALRAGRHRAAAEGSGCGQHDGLQLAGAAAGRDHGARAGAAARAGRAGGRRQVSIPLLSSWPRSFTCRLCCLPCRTDFLAPSHKHCQHILPLQLLRTRTSHTNVAMRQSICWASKVVKMLTSVHEVLNAPRRPEA